MPSTLPDLADTAWDVVIVGAGPAGAATAITLARFGQRVLLVDDVYVSGKSWQTARELLPAGLEVLPFVLKGRVDFALIRDVDGCVQWPWRSY